MDRAENLLAFGLLGRGKGHLVCAVGHELVRRGYQTLFVPAAKKEVDLEATLRRSTASQSFLITSDTSSRVARKWTFS